MFTLILVAAIAAQLRRRSEAKTAFDGIRRNHPAAVEPQHARVLLASWYWEADLIDHLMDGFVKAKALDDSQQSNPVAF